MGFLEIGPAEVQVDSKVYWIGDDGLIRRLDGFTPVRISESCLPTQKAASEVQLEQGEGAVFELSFDAQGLPQARFRRSGLLSVVRSWLRKVASLASDRLRQAAQQLGLVEADPGRGD